MTKLWKPILVAGLSLVCLSACGTTLSDFLNQSSSTSTTVSSTSASQTGTHPEAALSQEDAVLKALELIGLTSSDEVDNLVVTPATFNSKPIYDIAFVYDEVDYLFTIDGQTGELVDKTAPQVTAGTTTGAEKLTSDQALTIAFVDFGSVYGVTSDDVDNLSVEPAGNIYKVSFDYIGIAFAYHIDAQTGEIVDFFETDL